ncbi:Histidinol-phosphate aminotransferase [Cupriavidus yeoncheonensis]|uniref:threonine-phosphate decarboxylase n=1 Tax=Cupriavidus yeoncheonensis TaxID=1462994 RepID=A0A916IRC5_9BURK|nr:threonine-phosphate decarboxylase CobD [Cupriavidus yeoncheonensis]CAG2128954.1 Histidinol-phosphate aminotransferase [Cupriavidus yeoncheonensis]
MKPALSPIRHGGDLQAAVRRYGRPAAEWLDLSTGINPTGYPVPPIHGDAWRRLPEDDDGLAQIAARAFGAQQALPVAGSQAAIRTLPQLLGRGRVGVAALGYSEYAPAFAAAGHDVVLLGESDFAQPSLADGLDHLVVVNPNNPTGRLLPPEALLNWHATLARRGGTLIVDEAFIDCTPGHSIAARSGAPGLVVLRSLGKFFGLAGVRCGFVLGERAWLDALDERLGHWTVSGPARVIARAALADTAWQAANRDRLAACGERLSALLRRCGLQPVMQPLFCWVPHEDAARLHDALARHGVWTRRFDAAGDCPPGLRLGLPPDTPLTWRHLEAALAAVMRR